MISQPQFSTCKQDKMRKNNLETPDNIIDALTICFEKCPARIEAFWKPRVICLKFFFLKKKKDLNTSTK